MRHKAASLPLCWSIRVALQCVLILAAAHLARASSVDVIYTFTGRTDGADPYAGLTMDRAGNFYGTTSSGGLGYGTVFKLSKVNSQWVLTTLYRFAGGNDGSGPLAGVYVGPDGNLYGTTYRGGGTGCHGFGCGTIFTVKKFCLGSLCQYGTSIIYRFTGGSDGAQPSGPLVFDRSGAIYGTAVNGGLHLGCGGPGCGVVFKVAKGGLSWTEHVLYQFAGGTDAQLPIGGVIFDSAGNLYGTTESGGSHGLGTVFELTSSGSGWTEQILYSFHSTIDGYYPQTGLIFDSRNNLYGATVFGGSSLGGTIFELARSGGGWSHTVLYNLSGNAGPFGRLFMDSVGNLYATSYQDGRYVLGSAFELTAGTWTYSSLHDFTGGSDGQYPQCNLTLAPNGRFYGTTSFGGGGGHGTILEIDP